MGAEYLGNRHHLNPGAMVLLDQSRDLTRRIAKAEATTGYGAASKRAKLRKERGEVIACLRGMFRLVVDNTKEGVRE